MSAAGEAGLLARAFTECAGPLVLVDADGSVTGASRGMTELLGRPADALPGEDFLSWFVPPGPGAAPEDRSDCSDGRPRQFQLRHAAGGLVPVEVSCNTFDPGDGSLRRVFSLMDVRQREQEDQLRAARLAKLHLLNQVNEALYGANLNLDQILQAVLISMTAGEGLRFNRSFMLLVDEARGVLKGELAIGPASPEEAARIWSDLADRPVDLFEMMTSYGRTSETADAGVNEIVSRMEVPLTEEDDILVRSMYERGVTLVEGGMNLPGVERLQGWLGCGQCAVAPLATPGGPLGVIVADNAISGTPITDLDLEFLQMFANQGAHAIENSRLYHELERRLLDLRKAHERQKDDQQTLLRMERLSVMGETSAIVAHELRNPLVAIGGFARTLLRALDEDDERRQYASIISDEVGRMEEIIHDLLDFIRPRKLMRVETPIDELVSECCEKLRLELDERGVSLDVQAGCAGSAVECHPGEIQQVLQNYLMNAGQAQPDGGEIVVRTLPVDGGVRVEVLDRGPGIARENEKKLFAPFFSTKATGSGLGLTICVQIIKSHGGVTGAANRDDGGAAFWFILPLPRESRAD